MKLYYFKTYSVMANVFVQAGDKALLEPVSLEVLVGFHSEVDHEHLTSKLEKVVGHLNDSVFAHKDADGVDALARLGIRVHIVEDGHPGYEDIASRILVNLQRMVGVNGCFQLKARATQPGHDFHIEVIK